MQGYILNLLILVLISAILSTSLNFIIGHVAIYSMAQVTFLSTPAIVMQFCFALGRSLGLFDTCARA